MRQPYRTDFAAGSYPGGYECYTNRFARQRVSETLCAECRISRSFPQKTTSRGERSARARAFSRGCAGESWSTVALLELLARAESHAISPRSTRALVGGALAMGRMGGRKREGRERIFGACSKLSILCVVAGAVRVAIVTQSLHW